MDGEKPCFAGGAYHPLWAAYTLCDLGFEKTARFCLFHSRTMIEFMGNTSFWTIEKSVISRLGIADKLAIIYTPIWMYCREELNEYISHEKNVEINALVGRKDRVKRWKQVVDAKCHAFVNEWKDKAYAIHQY